MQRLVFAFILSLTAACGGSKTFGSLCTNDPPPAACNMACNPQPGAANDCPSGFHCTPDGKCDAQCTPGGTECGDGYACRDDGTCVDNSGPGSNGPDMNCPAVTFTPTKTTPSIELVVDRSGSMLNNFGGVSRYQALENGLFGATGAIPANQANVYFGAALFAGDQTPCLNLNGFTAPRALNNANALQTLITTHDPQPNGNTPTADAIDKVVADFAANPPPAGSPPIILLTTDGEPNSCAGGGGNGPSIASAQAAHAKNIQLFILGLAGLNTQYLQDMANAGQGLPTGQGPGCANCAPFFVANDPAALTNAFNQIINGVLSCDLSLTSSIDPTQAMNGVVTVNGKTLVFGTDWMLVNGTIIRLIGQACTDFKKSTNPMVNATFPCGSVIF